MATPISIGSPSFLGAGSVTRFLSDFKTFAVLHDWEDKKQLTLFPLCLSGIARDEYDGPSDKCKKDLQSVLDALEAAFPSGGPVEAQVKLRGLKFVPGQNLDAFIIQLRSLVGAAFPGAAVDQLLFNYFLQSLPDDFQRQCGSGRLSGVAPPTLPRWARPCPPPAGRAPATGRPLRPGGDPGRRRRRETFRAGAGAVWTCGGLAMHGWREHCLSLTTDCL